MTEREEVLEACSRVVRMINKGELDAHEVMVDLLQQDMDEEATNHALALLVEAGLRCPDCGMEGRDLIMYTRGQLDGARAQPARLRQPQGRPGSMRKRPRARRRPRR